MSIKTIITLIFFLIYQVGMACDACKKQQPKITQGFTHGAGPESNWDWVIIIVISIITLLTFVFSLKYLIRPGEKNNDHIKKTILSN
jgi:hypothetical protein